MPHLSKVVTYINETLAENVFGDKRFSGSGLYGIATQVPCGQDAKETYKLAVLDQSGEVLLDDCMYDQNEPLRLFHRIEGIGYTRTPQEDYGDENAYSRRVTMQMIVFADKKHIQLAAEDLELMLFSGFPATVEPSELPAGIGNCHFTILNSNLNQSIILADTFRIQEYSMEPQVVLLSLKYTIEYGVDSRCIKMLCCP